MMNKILILILLFNQIMISQNLPSNFYPNKLIGDDVNTFLNQKKTEIKTLFLNKYGKPLDKNVSFFMLDEFNLGGNPVCLISSNLVMEGYLCPSIIVEQLSSDDVVNEGYFQTILDRIDYFLPQNHQKIAQQIDRLSEIINFKCEIDNDSTEYLKLLSDKINVVNKTLKKKEMRQELYFSIFVFLGEKIAKKLDGKWEVYLEGNFSHNVIVNCKNKKINIYTYLKTFDSVQDGINLEGLIKIIGRW